MNQHNTLNIKLSNSQLNMLNSWINNGTEVTLKFSKLLIRNYNHEINFPHKILLTDTQVSKLCKAFSNGLSANKKFLKIELSNMIQSGEFLTDMSRITSALDNFVSILLKMGNSYLKELSNMGNKKIQE